MVESWLSMRSRWRERYRADESGLSCQCHELVGERVLALLMIIETRQHFGDSVEQRRLVLLLGDTGLLQQSANRRQDGAMILDEHLQLRVMA